MSIIEALGTSSNNIETTEVVKDKVKIYLATGAQLLLEFTMIEINEEQMQIKLYGDDFKVGCLNIPFAFFKGVLGFIVSDSKVLVKTALPAPTPVRRDYNR